MVAWHGMAAPGTADTRQPECCLLLQALAEVAPAEVHATLRAPLEAAVLSGQQDDDRPRTYAAAEVLAGLLAAGQWSETGAGRTSFPVLPLLSEGA